MSKAGSENYAFTPDKVVESYGNAILNCMRAQTTPRLADFPDIDHGFDALYGMTTRRREYETRICYSKPWRSVRQDRLSVAPSSEVKLKILDLVNSTMFPVESIAGHNQSAGIVEVVHLADVVPISHGEEIRAARGGMEVESVALLA